MIEIISEKVKQSVINQLLSLFPEVSIYKEQVAFPNYPHFFVYQVTLTDEERISNHHILSYLMNIRYRVASDSSTEPKLMNKLDNVALRLTTGFNLIALDDEYIRVTNKSIEKDEGVLFFTCNLNIMTKLVDKDKEHNKFNNIDIKVGLNGK